MSRKHVKVLAPIFTKHEALRLDVRNGSGKRAIHEVAFFSCTLGNSLLSDYVAHPAGCESLLE